jgi:FkbM family methyltransferase
MFRRLLQFLVKPWPQKFQSLGFRWIRYLPGIPLPIRLPFGAWWLLENDFTSAALLDGRFEERERAFVARFLQPGMTVLDIGAHKGLYTLISSFKVGPDGYVFSFEPSSRERKRLKKHLRLNLCHNVKVFDLALGESAGRADFFVVQGTETGCNSLRPPDVKQPVQAVSVPVKSLDEVLSEQQIPTVDFIKLDVEGAELSVLKGAANLLSSTHRPTILCEVQDQRTAPWGYSAGRIIEYLRSHAYSWFQLDETGILRPLSTNRSHYDGNFVACPEESEPTLNHLKA